MKSILILCEGNICRSPMAQGVLAAAMPRSRVRSAGLGALVGTPADPIAVKLMDERGIAIDDHRAIQLNQEMCLDADLVLVMDSEQRERVQATYPHCRGRVFKVGEYIKRDIPDPFRKGESAFREALDLIDHGTAEWLNRFKKL